LPLIPGTMSYISLSDNIIFCLIFECDPFAVLVLVYLFPAMNYEVTKEV
jgi:hypothetical protein